MNKTLNRENKYYTILVIILVIITSTGCTVQEKIGSNTIEVVSSGFKKNLEVSLKEKTEPKEKDSLKITDYFLPEQNSKPRTETITHVVIHFMSNVSKKPQQPYDIEDMHSIFVDYGVSTHYIIDRQGEIYRVVPEDRVAYHAGTGRLPDFPDYKDKLNEYSIGIELLAIGTKEEMSSMISGNLYDSINPSLKGYTEVQYKSLNVLLEDVLKRNPNILGDRKYIVGHSEYAGSRKPDPGALFDWSKVKMTE